MLFWRPLASSHKQRPKIRIVAAVIAPAVTLITCLISVFYINSLYRMGIQINPNGLVVCTALTPFISLVLYFGLGWIQRKADGILKRYKPSA